MELKLPTLEDRLSQLETKFIMVDFKLRDGKWWGRGIVSLQPRNNDRKSEKVEATADTLEECVGLLLAQ